MKRLLALSIACLTIAISVPAMAQPLDIIVRGGNPATLPSPIWQGNDYNYGWPNNAHGDNFDPAAAAINALNVSFPRRGSNFPVNISRAGDLANHRGSWTERQEVCQARYSSYDMISDTIIVNGLPRRCPY
jgi:hypothetical protein